MTDNIIHLYIDAFFFCKSVNKCKWAEGRALWSAACTWTSPGTVWEGETWGTAADAGSLPRSAAKEPCPADSAFPRQRRAVGRSLLARAQHTSHCGGLFKLWWNRSKKNAPLPHCPCLLFPAYHQPITICYFWFSTNHLSSHYFKMQPLCSFSAIPASIIFSHHFLQQQ